MDDFERADARMDLAPLLAQVTPRYCQAFLLWVDGYTQEEIGQAMGICHQTVSKYIARARKELTSEGGAK